MVITTSKFTEQVNPVTEFPNLFPNTMLVIVAPHSEVNPSFDSKLGSKCLPTCKVSPYKFTTHIKNEFNIEVDLGHMYATTNNKNAGVICCIAE